jgi:hypothetical protein
MRNCPLCSQLKEVETSFYKYAAPNYDRPLPLAASRLTVLLAGEGEEQDKHHIRRCPLCATLYDYVMSYEYLCNGSEDEETLRRLTNDEAEGWRKTWVRELETQRRSIEGLLDRAGSLGDYIDRGRPSSEELTETYDEMQRCRIEAGDLQKKLEERVLRLRREAPDILSYWVEGHIRVCRFFLDAPTDRTDDAGARRYIARTTLEAWQALPGDGETFVSVNTAWLDDYLARWDRELDRPL